LKSANVRHFQFSTFVAQELGDLKMQGAAMGEAVEATSETPDTAPRPQASGDEVVTGYLLRSKSNDSSRMGSPRSRAAKKYALHAEIARTILGQISNTNNPDKVTETGT